MTTPTSSLCTTCNGPHPRADGFMPQHPFNDGSLGASLTFGPPRDRPRKSPERPSGGTAAVPTPAPLHSWPHDPVLRMALINKGVLTPEDLRNAEQQIRAITAEVMQDGT